jgi:glycosyltransferase involved in cell wall biosynthesis
MRITIVQGPYLPVPPLLGGAVERSMLSLGRHWAAAGCQVTHLSRRFPGLPDAETLEGVRHLRVASRDAPAGRLSFRWHEWLYCRRVKAVLPPADIIVTNSVIMPLLLREARFGKLVVRMERPPKGQLRFYRHAALIQTVSQDMRARILAAAPDLAARVSVVGSPLDGALAPLAEPPAGAERRITYVGRLHPEKGVDLLIGAFRGALDRMREAWTLTIVGPHEGRAGGGGDAWLERLRALAAAAGDRVAFTGAIFDPDRLAAHLRSSAIFAYPSLAERGEALPMAPLEAMGQGVVPVVSALACFRDYLDPGSNGLAVDLRDGNGEAALATALLTLMNDPLRLARMRGLACRTAQTYAAARVAERHLQDFRQMLAR